MRSGSLIRKSHAALQAATEVTANQREGLNPSDRHIVVRRNIIAHRLRQTPLLLQPIVTSLFQFTDSVSRKEFPCHATPGLRALKRGDDPRPPSREITLHLTGN